MTPAGSFTVLSDLDDTIKISNTCNRFRTVLRGLFTSQVYAGMPELFQEWGKQGAHLRIMSSSPVWIRDRIRGFLRKHRFPEIEVTLRDWLKEKEVRAYKRAKLKLLHAQADHPMVLVGDDSEWDPEVFHEFRQQDPGKVLAIYIRRVRNRPLPQDVIPFSTAFDVALSEYRSGRLTAPQVSRVGKAILEQKNADFIIPYFVTAPEGLSCSLEAPFESIQARLHERLLEIHAEHQRAGNG